MLSTSKKRKQSEMEKEKIQQAENKIVTEVFGKGHKSQVVPRFQNIIFGHKRPVRCVKKILDEKIYIAEKKIPQVQNVSQK